MTPPSLKDIRNLYYTAQQAREVLGLEEDEFQDWIGAGRINRYVFPPRKRGLYLKTEIDGLAERVAAEMLAVAMRAQQEREALAPSEAALVYRQAMLADLPAEYDLCEVVFGSRAKSPQIVEARRAYLETNPETFWHLYDKGQLVAFINIVPLDHLSFLEFKEGKRGWTYSTDHIRQFVPGEPLECIIIDMVTTPAVPPQKRRHYGKRLLEGVAQTLTAWGRRGVEIAAVCAAGASPAGQHILEAAGFASIKDMGNSRILYELDVQNATLHLLRGYKAAIAGYKASHA